MRRRGTSLLAAAAPAAAPLAAAVDSLQRGLEVLRCFHPGEDLLQATEITRRLGLSRTTTRRLLDTLAAQGFLQRSTDGEAFRLHVASFVVGQATLSGSALVRAAKPQLHALADQFSVHALLCVGDRGELLVLSHQSGVAAQPWLLGAGARLPLGDTAPGHAWLWAQSSATQGEFLARMRERASTSSSLASVWRAFHDLETRGTCSSVWSGRGGVSITAAALSPHEGLTAVICCVKVGMEGSLDPACAHALQQCAQAIRDEVQRDPGRR